MDMSKHPTMKGILMALSPDEKEALFQKILDGAAAHEIAYVLTAHGHSVSATTIKKFRRDLIEHTA